MSEQFFEVETIWWAKRPDATTLFRAFIVTCSERTITVYDVDQYIARHETYKTDDLELVEQVFSDE